MRRSRYNFYRPDAASNVGSVEVGETHVKMLSPGSSVPVSARIVGRTYDKENRLTSIVLDALVHEKYKTNYGEFEAWGVFVTELAVKDRLLDKDAEEEGEEEEGEEEEETEH